MTPREAMERTEEEGLRCRDCPDCDHYPDGLGRMLRECMQTDPSACPGLDDFEHCPHHDALWDPMDSHECPLCAAGEPERHGYDAQPTRSAYTGPPEPDITW